LVSPEAQEFHASSVSVCPPLHGLFPIMTLNLGIAVRPLSSLIPRRPPSKEAQLAFLQLAAKKRWRTPQLAFWPAEQHGCWTSGGSSSSSSSSSPVEQGWKNEEIGGPSGQASSRPRTATSKALKLLRSARQECPAHAGVLRLLAHALDGSPLGSETRRDLLAVAEGLEASSLYSPHLAYAAGRSRSLLGDFADAVRHMRRAVQMTDLEVFPLRHLEGLIFMLRATGQLQEAQARSHELYQRTISRLKEAAEAAGGSTDEVTLCSISPSSSSSSSSTSPSSSHFEFGNPLERYLTQRVSTRLFSGDFDTLTQGGLDPENGLEAERPPSSCFFALLDWHFSRGMAFAAHGDAKAQFELESLSDQLDYIKEVLHADPQKYGRLPAITIGQVKLVILRSAINRLDFTLGVEDEARNQRSIRLLRSASNFFNELKFDDPPCIFLSPDLYRGADLLGVGQVREALGAFATPLEVFDDQSLGAATQAASSSFLNDGLAWGTAAPAFAPMALHGLWQACATLADREPEAASRWSRCSSEAARKLQEIWNHSDGDLISPTQAECLSTQFRSGGSGFGMAATNWLFGDVDWNAAPLDTLDSALAGVVVAAVVLCLLGVLLASGWHHSFFKPSLQYMAVARMEGDGEEEEEEARLLQTESEEEGEGNTEDEQEQEENNRLVAQRQQRRRGQRPSQQDSQKAGAVEEEEDEEEGKEQNSTPHAKGTAGITKSKAERGEASDESEEETAHGR